MRRETRVIAIGGVTTGLAVVIMSLGGLIPLATYVCPMLCMVLLHFVTRLCGHRIAWSWYAAVTVLSLLLGPDKEAAGVFLALGYYPIVKPLIDGKPLRIFWKLLLFNGATLALYASLLYLFGLSEVVSEFQELGYGMAAILLVLGNAVFFLLDVLLNRLRKR